MQTLCIANQKGGCGKTTTVLNLGAGLAGRGLRVLMVDMDPQSSLTLATVGDRAGRSMAEVLGDTQTGRLTMRSTICNISPALDLAPSDIALSMTELGISTRMGRENLLKRALATVKDYDVCLVDCGPTLGLLVVNALAAADAVLVPTLPAALDLRGLKLFLESLDQVRQELNPGLQLLGILLCQFDGRTKLHQAALESLQAGGLPVLPFQISRSVKVSESVGSGQPITSGAIAEQYQQLTEETYQWLKNR